MNRKIITTLLGVMAAVSIASADYEVCNLFGGIGYGFGMGGTLYRSTNTATPATEVKDRFFNYGQGLKFDVGCQYFIMDKIALQGSLFYSAGVPGFKQDSTTALIKQSTSFGYSNYGFKLHLVPKFQVLDLIDMYAGVGTGLYFNNRSFKITRETTVGSQSASGTIESSPSLGFSGMLGLDYPLSDKVTLFGELGFEQLSVNLSKYKIKDSNITGRPSGGTVYNYEKDAVGTNNYQPENVAGSNFQIRIGARYALF